jgi:hypothetical protein
VRDAQPGIERDSPLGAAERLLQLPELPESGAQIAVCYRIVGSDLERKPVASDGVGRLTEFQERVAEVVLCFSRARVDWQCPLIESHRLAGLS